MRPRHALDLAPGSVAPDRRGRALAARRRAGAEADQDRLPGPAHRRCRPDRARHREWVRDVPGGGRAPDRGPQGRADRRGHRGQPGHRHHQVPQARRERSGGHGGGRGVRAHRVRPRPEGRGVQDAHHLPGDRGGRPHPAEAVEVGGAPRVDREPAVASVRGVRGEDPGLQEGRGVRNRLRVRLRGGRRVPAELRGGRAARSSRSCGPRSGRAIWRPTSPSSSATPTRPSSSWSRPPRSASRASTGTRACSGGFR